MTIGDNGGAETPAFDMEAVRDFAKAVYEKAQPQCIAVYLGGSVCDGFVERPHDVDLICFSDAPVGMCAIRRAIHRMETKGLIPKGYDLVQVRTKQREERAYGSYINKRMVKLIGEDVPFSFDVIDADRDEYLDTLIDAMRRLNDGRIRNQKRWYQVLRGYWIVKNRTYDLTEDQIRILNEVHDQVGGWEKHKITEADVSALKGGR